MPITFEGEYGLTRHQFLCYERDVVIEGLGLKGMCQSAVESSSSNWWVDRVNGLDVDATGVMEHKEREALLLDIGRLCELILGTIVGHLQAGEYRLLWLSEYRNSELNDAVKAITAGRGVPSLSSWDFASGWKGVLVSILPPMEEQYFEWYLGVCGLVVGFFQDMKCLGPQKLAHC